MPEQVHPAEAASSRGRLGNAVPHWLLVLAPALFLMVAGWHFRRTADDAFNLGLFGFGAGPRVFVCDSHGLSDPLGSRLRQELCPEPR